MSVHRTRREVAAALAALLALAGAHGAAAQSVDEAALVGVWEGSESAGGISVGGRVILFPDGRYERLHVLGQLMTMDTGQWRLAENWLHFAVQDYEPKVYQGIPQYAPPSDTWVIDWFDGQSFHATIGGVAEAVYRRVQ